MGVRYPTAMVNTAPNSVPAAGTEGVIMGPTPPINLPVDGALVLLWAFFTSTPGTGVTAYQPRIRRGTTIAGTQVFPVTGGAVAVTAGNITFLSILWFDSPGILAEIQYVLTCIATGGVVGSGLQDACLAAIVL